MFHLWMVAADAADAPSASFRVGVGGGGDLAHISGPYFSRAKVASCLAASLPPSLAYFPYRCQFDPTTANDPAADQVGRVD